MSKKCLKSLKVGILCKDFRFGYRVALELKKRSIPYEMLLSEDQLKEFEVIISDMQDHDFIHCSTPEECARKVHSYLYGKRRFERVIVGIDPGPKPGIVVVGDGNFVEEVQLSSVDKVKSYVDEVYRGYSPEHFIIRIGDGDIVNRNRIINSLVENYRVEMVDERNTSEAINNKDIESAKVIAFTRGRLVRNKLNVVIREGYLKEIQRRSRIESGGKITISKELAREVALGKMSLKDAVALMGGKDEER